MTSQQDMKDIIRCAICGRTLAANRKHVDTCGERCYKVLLARQRETFTASLEN